jgi:hypothetical protein
MCVDTAVVSAVPPWTLEALLHDPLVRMVMHADGVTPEDILAAVQVAHQAISAGEPAPRSSPPRQGDPFGQADDPRGHSAISGQPHL